jgi:hypothetical protein
MQPGSRWVAANMQEFEIVSVNGDWVRYRRLRDLAEFSCLQGAFKQRFSPISNT